MNIDDVPASRSVDGAQSIRRAIALMRRLAEVGSDGDSVAGLARATGIDRTTAHRILKCMAEEGLLRCTNEKSRYVLGPLAYEMGLAAGDQMDLRTICGTALQNIAARTGDTVFLMARSGYDAVCADRREGSYPVKTFVVDIGSRRPLGVGAGSLAILSALTPEECEAAIQHNAARIREFSGVKVERLHKLAARVRADRFAVMDVVDLPGVRALAVALHTPNGRPVAAISVAAINSRMTRQRQAVVLEILKAECAKLRPALHAAA